MSRPLPPGWEERPDILSGRFYYVDTKTGRSQWEDPRANEPLSPPTSPYSSAPQMPSSPQNTSQPFSMSSLAAALPSTPQQSPYPPHSQPPNSLPYPVPYPAEQQQAPYQSPTAQNVTPYQPQHNVPPERYNSVPSPYVSPQHQNSVPSPYVPPQHQNSVPSPYVPPQHQNSVPSPYVPPQHQNSVPSPYAPPQPQNSAPSPYAPPQRQNSVPSENQNSALFPYVPPQSQNSMSQSQNQVQTEGKFPYPFDPQQQGYNFNNKNKPSQTSAPLTAYQPVSLQNNQQLSAPSNPLYQPSYPNPGQQVYPNVQGLQKSGTSSPYKYPFNPYQQGWNFNNKDNPQSSQPLLPYQQRVPPTGSQGSMDPLTPYQPAQPYYPSPNSQSYAGYQPPPGNVVYTQQQQYTYQDPGYYQHTQVVNVYSQKVDKHGNPISGLIPLMPAAPQHHKPSKTKSITQSFTGALNQINSVLKK